MSDADVRGYFQNTISLDLLSLVCGDVLGDGIGRTVYECSMDPELVVKVEVGAGSFQNVHEWQFWDSWRHHKSIARWLAPCRQISPCGTILLQARTTPVPAKRLPSKLPKFLTDTKSDNYGLLNGKVVCHDYGFVVSEAPETLRKAQWW